ncbi:oligosaccharide flippase family protein [Paenibacillus beijingensis]|uniref:Membrane protein n=1 Tax=Paenibacillus beijingensis TaxID=1126833 RepID=A0A0D5NFD5_9BACL|nr:oligosaccharide flippase family protein [Paenibacillus beijingensis]AJY73971.1 membrane protein [Paenibacillus beijingensis]
MSLTAIRRVFTGSGFVQTIFKTSATNFLVMATATITALITARMFGVEGKGELSTVLFWPSFLAGLTGFGLPTSLIYNTKKHGENVTDYLRLCFMYQLPISIIVGVLTWLYLPVWLGNYPGDVIKTAQWFTVLNMPLLLVVNVLQSLAQSLNKFNVYNSLRLNVPLFNLIGLIVLWGFGNLSIPSAAVVYLTTTVLVIFGSLYRLREYLNIKWLVKIKRFAYTSLFGYGIRVYGTEFIGTMYNQFDKLIIISFLSAKEMGLYTVMYTCSRLFNVVQSAITSVVFPKVTGMKKEEIIQKVGTAFRISLFFMLIIAIPGMIIGRFLIGLFFGEAFLEASTTLYILCIECIIGGSSWILSASFNAIGRPGLVLIRQLLALSITIGSFYMLVPHLGLIGVAIALLIGSFVRMIFSISSIIVLFKVPFQKIIFDKSDLNVMKQFILNRKTRSVN